MSRWKHEAGDCWPDRCEFCAQEIHDARPPTPDELAEMKRILRESGRPQPVDQEKP